MKKLIFIAATLTASCAQAQQTAPEPTVTVTLTVSQFNLIISQLSALPWKDSNAAMVAMINAANAQLGPQAAPDKKD